MNQVGQIVLIKNTNSVKTLSCIQTFENLQQIMILNFFKILTFV